MPISVVSVAEASCLDTWQVGSWEIPRRISATAYNVIVPDLERDLFARVTNPTIAIQGEDDFTALFRQKLEGVASANRFGWYLQQLIKLEAVRRNGSVDVDTILWDADTIPLRDLDFWSVTGEPQYFVGHSHHLPYFRTIDRLLGMDRVVPNSFIAQSFPISARLSRDFFSYIENKHGTPWYDAVLDSIDFDEPAGFSEYETLGTFVSNVCDVNWGSETWTHHGYRDLGSPGLAIASAADALHPFAFAAFERWDLPSRSIFPSFRGRERTKFWRQQFERFRKLRGIVSRAFRRNQRGLDATIARIFASELDLEIAQIGAGDGESHDFLRVHLAKPGGYTARLVEPNPTYFSMVSRLYSGRPDVAVFQCAAGSSIGSMTLYTIPQDVADRMDGCGPPNLWARGQSSNSRATIVHWIWKNAFRGKDYQSSILEFISSITPVEVSVRPTADFIGPNPHKVFLVVDSQGMEFEVISGLTKDSLPRWICIEEDLGDLRARSLLLDLGYKLIVDGADPLFQLDKGSVRSTSAV
jgi:Family of unknown function (DUF6492)